MADAAMAMLPAYRQAESSIQKIDLTLVANDQGEMDAFTEIAGQYGLLVWHEVGEKLPPTADTAGQAKFCDKLRAIVIPLVY
ncbi:MAG: hypothetical protein Q7S46_11170 [Gallionella sp.]|nr:hypothetical protein [Gallionella sp.]